MEKYRVHEVAKDFGLPTKTITEILTKYATTPKNHMQVLETNELDVIFEYMTQHNQVDNLQDIFNVPAKAEPVKEAAAPAPVVQAASNDGEVVAAIIAAIEAYRSANGATAPGGFRVVSFKKRF